MRSWAVPVIGLSVIAIALYVVLLMDDRSPDAPVNGVEVAVESGEVLFSNGTKTNTVTPGEGIVALPDGTITRSPSRDAPSPEGIYTPTPIPALPLLASLALSVRDTEGNAVSEATATVRQENAQHVARLNEKGSAVIEGLHPGNAKIGLSHPLILAGAETDAVLREGPNEVAMVVARRALYSAYVKNEANEPVRSALIILSPQFDAQRVEKVDLSQRSPDDEGLFAFDPVVSGEYVLSISAEPYLPYVEAVLARDSIELKTIVLSVNGKVEVAVENEEGDAIGGAHVTLRSARGSGRIVLVNQTNDLTGKTLFEDIPPGGYHVSAEHVRYYDRGKGDADIRVEKSGHEVKLTLADKAYRISGRVYEKESGKPIEGAEVVAIMERSPALQPESKPEPSAKVTTKKDGTYTVEGLRGGTYIVGVSPHEDYITIPLSEEGNLGAPSPTRVLLDQETEVTGIDFLLLLPWIVSGRVLLSDGSPVEGAEVNTWSRYYMSLDRRSNYATRPRGQSAVKSGADGTYRLVGIGYVFDDRCETLLTANHDLYKGSKDAVIHPEPGKELTGVDLVFEEKVLVSGTVTDVYRQPIDDARVCFWKPDRTAGPIASSNAEGIYQIALEPDTYDYRVTHEGFRHFDGEEPLTLEPGKTYDQLDFILQPGEETFEGQVTEEDGTPVSGLEVVFAFVFRSAGENTTYTKGSTQTDADGRFRLAAHEVSKMTHFLIFTKPTEIYEEARVETPEWGMNDIHLVVERKKGGYGSISGMVVDRNRDPVSRFSIRVIPSQTRDSLFFGTDYNWRTLSHPDGVFVFDRIWIQDGPFVILAKTDDSAPAFSELISLEENEVREGVVVPLQQSFTVSGRMLTPEGLPAPRALARLKRVIDGMEYRRYEESLPGTEADENGAFRLRGIPLSGGELELSADRGKYRGSLIVPIGQAGEERDLGTIMLQRVADPEGQ